MNVVHHRSFDAKPHTQRPGFHNAADAPRLDLDLAAKVAEILARETAQ